MSEQACWRIRRMPGQEPKRNTTNKHQDSGWGTRDPTRSLCASGLRAASVLRCGRSRITRDHHRLQRHSNSLPAQFTRVTEPRQEEVCKSRCSFKKTKGKIQWNQKHTYEHKVSPKKGTLHSRKTITSSQKLNKGRQKEETELECTRRNLSIPSKYVKPVKNMAPT